MEEIKYESSSEGAPWHSIHIRIEGRIIGYAEIFYSSKPFPLYHIRDLKVIEEFENQKYATKIMEFVENMLKEKHKAGVLQDGINSKSPARGMYARRGWLPVPATNNANADIYAFNLPKNASVDQLRGVMNRVYQE